MILVRLLALTLLVLSVSTTRADEGGIVVSQPQAEADDEFLPEARRQQREAFSGIGVDERLGEEMDLAIPFRDHRGNPVTLADYFTGEQPVALTFVYHDCPMLCSLVLDGVGRALQQTSLRLGQEYRMLAISIHPGDTPELAAAAHDRYRRYLPENADPEAFIFLTGTEDAIARVTEEIGFNFRWLEDQQEYGHTAMVAFLSPTGQITRYLYGLEFPSSDFRRALVEAGQGTIGTPVDQLILYCFAYDPSAGGYVLQASNAMRLGGFATVILLSLSLFFFWRREKRANEASRNWLDGEDPLRIATSP